MDFDLTDRQKHWRDRVRQFIQAHVRPRHKDYKAQQAEGMTYTSSAATSAAISASGLIVDQLA